MNETRRAIAAALLVVSIALVLYAIHPAFFVRDDFQLQYLPGSREVARAWMSGEVPLLSRYSWTCAGLGAEYQFAIFSLFRALLDIVVWLLPLSLNARGAFLFIVHAAIVAAGAYRLARSYDAGAGASFAVAIIAGLNGWILWWGTTWLPGIAAFAWLPWYWLGLRKQSFALTAISLYLLISAGWPYAVLMAVAVGVLALVRRQWKSIAASLVGAGLAAPSILMLLEYFPYTARQSAKTALSQLWIVPPPAFFGTIVPAFSAVWNVFNGPFPHAAVEFAGAFIPLAALLAGARRDWLRTHVPELLLLAALVILMLLPSGGPFRWSFRWLPLFHLLLAVLGASALRRKTARYALALITIAAAASIAFDREPRTTLLHAAILGALCLIWFLVDHPAMPAAITAAIILLTFVTFSHRSEVARWPYDEALLSRGVFDPARRYLAMYDADQITTRDEFRRDSRGLRAEWRPGNTPMLAGVEFVNGYSPLGLAGLRNLFSFNIHGPMARKRAEIFLRYESGRDQLLHHAGIDGLIVPETMVAANRDVLARNGWRPVARLADALLLHRAARPAAPVTQGLVARKIATERDVYAAIFARDTEQFPFILYTRGKPVEEYGPRVVERVEEGRNHTSVTLRDGPRALLVFRRPWLPGWRAKVDGQSVPVLRADMIMPAVEVPAGGRDVRLYYRPTSLIAGLAIAALSLVVLVVVALKT